MLRVNQQTAAFHNVVGITILSTKTRKLTFKQYASGPFGSSKFHILQDPDTVSVSVGRPGVTWDKDKGPTYYALSTNVTDAAAHAGIYGARNNLVL